MSSIYTDKSEYAVSTWTMDRHDLHTALKAINAAGFKTVEIWADNVHIDPRVHPDIPEVKRWLRELGQDVHSVHSPFRGFTPRPESELDFRAFRMQLWHRTIDYCSELGCPIMVVHALNRSEYHYRMSERGIVRDCLAELCEYGRSAGVMIALENVSGGLNPGEINCSLRNQTQMFQGIGLKYCLDIGHVPLSGAEMYAEADAAGNNLVTFHIHNNNLREDEHNLPNDGLIDWPGLRSHVRKNGYTGKFVMEVEGRGDQAKVIESIGRLFD
jgi:sugar phosphate isomerase/epimerase